MYNLLTSFCCNMTDILFVLFFLTSSKFQDPVIVVTIICFDFCVKGNCLVCKYNLIFLVSFPKTYKLL